ncbi:MAG: hypothetical protein AAGU27_24025 [Dehalobacterium sp.]
MEKGRHSSKTPSQVSAGLRANFAQSDSVIVKLSKILYNEKTLRSI